MYKFPGIIVVEGATDVAFLSSFIEADFVITNGSDVPEETICYLKKAKEKRDIVILTDPDSPGKRIRDVLNSRIDGLLHAFVLKEHSIKHHKVGVAESTKEDVLGALEHLVPSKPNLRSSLTMSDLFDLGLMGCDGSNARREKLTNRLFLGHGNAKTMLKRINALGLSKEEIKETLDD